MSASGHMNAWTTALVAMLAMAGATQAAAQAAPAPVTTTGATAAAPDVAPAAPQVEEVLEELEEITVHGRRLRDRIIEAEDQFYKLYNQINKDDKYDTNCANVPDPRNPGSAIPSRLCLPVFVAEAVADYTAWRMRCQPPMEGFDEFSCLDRNRDERLSRQEIAARPELDAQMFLLDADNSGYLTRDELPEESFADTAPYQPPPPDLVLHEGSDRWARHMMSVIRSDPRLQEMAGKLDQLYYELGQAQRRTRELEASLPKDESRALKVRPPR